MNTSDLIWQALAVATGAGLGLVGVDIASAFSREAANAAAPDKGRQPASLRIITALTGAGFGLWAALARPGPIAPISAILAGWLLLLAVLDAKHLWLPLRLTAPLLAFGLVVSAIASGFGIQGALIGAAAGWLSFAALSWIYRRLRGGDGLGGGDAWLAGAAGAWVGWAALSWVVLIATLIALAAVAVQALRKRLDPSRPIPFGLYLAAGFWLVWIYGAAA